MNGKKIQALSRRVVVLCFILTLPTCVPANADVFGVLYFLTRKMITASGKEYEVRVSYNDKAEIPDGAELQVREVKRESEEYETYFSAATEAVKRVIDASFVDISIVKNDIEIEPQWPVKVEMIPLTDTPDGEVNVVHFAETPSESEEIEVLDTISEDKIIFQTESFSVFGVVYTVDYHWTINGKTYDYSLPGGDSISFRELIEKLDILGDEESATQNEVETVDQGEEDQAEEPQGEEDQNEEAFFLEDIVDISFSNPSLVYVAHTTENITAGALKEKYNLVSEYSEELTASQRKRMDEKVYAADDWVLISLKPFTTEETLTVKMEDGESFEIKVTDAQLEKDYISATGETYKITVVYDDAAEIPDGSELKVREILEGTDEFDQYKSSSMEELQVGELGFARFFDIEIQYNGEKIEPKVPVEVSIRNKEELETELGRGISIVHFGDDGTELIKEVELSEDRKEVTYEQGSFSVTGVIQTGTIATGENQQYALIVKYNNEYYSVDSDGTLTPAEVDDKNNPISVTLANAMLWRYDGSNIYHYTDAIDTNADKTADKEQYFYIYLTPDDATGLY